MTKKIGFVTLLSTVIVGCLCLGSLAMAEDKIGITLNGPYFSIPEPWVSNDFLQESVKHKGMRVAEHIDGGITDPAKLVTEQKRTVKTEDGKAYLLQVTGNDIVNRHEGLIVIGLRHVFEDERKVVTFYKVENYNNDYFTFEEHFSDGEMGTDYNLNAIYAGTLDGKPVKLIEYNDMRWERDGCKEYDENGHETGGRDGECLETAVSLEMNRCVFVVDEDSEAVVGNAVIKQLKKEYSSVEDAQKAASKVKKLADVNEFKLSDTVTCTKFKAEKLSRFNCVSKNKQGIIKGCLQRMVLWLKK